MEVLKDTVGIIGAAGDLGRKLTVQACAHFGEVTTFDTHPLYAPYQTGVDPSLLSAEGLTVAPQNADCLAALLERSSVVHWTAPLDRLDKLPGLPDTSLLVLHDSVMASSLRAAEALGRRPAILGQVSIAHCLTNEERSVVIATDVANERLINHIRQLGLLPILRSVKEHDRIMAHSQAVFAIICKLFRNDLEDYASAGLLTPSGRRLRTAIEDNASRWTDTTYDAITDNPELKDVVAGMLAALKT